MKNAFQKSLRQEQPKSSSNQEKTGGKASSGGTSFTEKTVRKIQKNH
jgi:hypothetical protein